MDFIYDGPSLPMLEMCNGKVVRIQQLQGGQWRTFETEEQYRDFILEVVEEGSLPQLTKEL